jgi:hypothetical protein
MRLSLALLASVIFASSSFADPATKTIKIPATLLLDKAGGIYDYKGATLVWTGRGDCSQRENMPPMFTITGEGITLKNAIIIGAPDGIHIHSAGVTLENLTFPNVCEDAVTFKKGAQRATVRDCHFAGAKDKVIQASYGKRHRVYRCRFENCTRAFRSKRGVTAIFYQNDVINCSSAVRADGTGSRTILWGNKFVAVRHPVQRLDGAWALRIVPSERGRRR